MNATTTPLAASVRPASIKKAPQRARTGRLSASDIVFRGVVRGLESRQFVPGQRLVEADLMAHFEVGRNSVREAMQRLAAEGLVDLSRHKGAAIRVMTHEEVLDLLDIVERILGLLTRKAVRSAGDEQYVRELKAAMQALLTADEQRDDAKFASARRYFYRTLLEMGGSCDLKRLFTTIHIPIIYAQQRVPALQKIRMADYTAIVEAVLSGDEDAADRAGAKHVRNVRDALLAKDNAAL